MFLVEGQVEKVGGGFGLVTEAPPFSMLPIPTVPSSRGHLYPRGTKLSRASGNGRDPVHEDVLGDVRRPEIVCRLSGVKRRSGVVDGADEPCPGRLADFEYTGGG